MEKKVEKTEEQLAQEVQQLNQKKVKAFVDEYNVLVKKHGISVVGIPSITPQGTLVCNLDVQPVPKEK